MRSIFIIIVFCSIFSLLDLSAQSAVPHTDQAATSFTESQLSELQKQAFERKAQQLIYDYFGYYELLQSNDLEPQLRTTIISAMLQLFHPSVDTIFLGKEIGLYSLEKTDFRALPSFKLTSVTLKEILPYSEEQLWIYQLSFSKTEIARGTATAILQQREKIFGETRKMVWDVQLLALDLRD